MKLKQALYLRAAVAALGLAAMAPTGCARSRARW
jgi:hypothetical protein